MVKDRQVRRLFKMKARGRSLTKAASHADIDEKTARKYLKLEKLPSEVKKSHTWRTRKDPFEDNWAEAERYLKRDFSLQAKTVFDFFSVNILADLVTVNYVHCNAGSKPGKHLMVLPRRSILTRFMSRASFVNPILQG
jgi:hypothetical protein